MLQAFIVTLREGVEAALIIGITLAYLSKIQRPDLRKPVFVALGSAFVASIGVATGGMMPWIFMRSPCSAMQAFRRCNWPRGRRSGERQ